MSLTINGVAIPVQGIRALKPGITIEQASQKTKNNGLDEIYFSSQGRSYVAYGDSLNISMLKKNQIPAVVFNNQKADIVAYDDEANSMLEGMRKGAINAVKDTSDSVSGAVKNIISTIGPTVGISAGVGIAGFGVYQLWKNSQGAGAALAATNTTGAITGIMDALKHGAIGGLKIIAVAGVVGTGITLAYGAFKGALEVKNGSKDYTSIASVTEDGTNPTNGGVFSPANSLPGAPPTQNPNPFNSPVSVPVAAPVTPGVPSGGFTIQITPMGTGAVSGMLSPQQLQAYRR